MTKLPIPIYVKIENMFNYKLETANTVEELIELLQKYKDAELVELEIYAPFLKL